MNILARWKNFIAENREILKLGTIFSVIYFVQSAGTLPDLPLLFIVKDILKLSPSQAQYFWAVAGMAWVIKPAWGYLSDHYPIFGYRRKSYLCAMALTASFVWFVMAYLSYYGIYKYYGLLVLFLLSGISYAAVDVVCDGLMTKNSKREDGTDYADRFVNLQWLGGAIAGALISYAYIIGVFPAEVPDQGKIVNFCVGNFCYRGPLISIIFLLTGLAPLMTLAVVLAFLKEERVKSVSAVKFFGTLLALYILSDWALYRPYPYYGMLANELKIALIFFLYVLLAWFLWLYSKKPPYYWMLIIFVFFWGYSPSVGAAMQYYLIDVLKFKGSFLALIGFLGGVAGIGGILLYAFALKIFRGIGYKPYLYFAVILASVGLLVDLLYLQSPGTKILGLTINFYFVAIASSIFFSLWGKAGFLIPLAIAAKVSRETENPAVLYAWFMSIINFTGMMSSLSGASMLDRLNALDLKNVSIQLSPFAVLLWILFAVWLCYFADKNWDDVGFKKTRVKIYSVLAMAGLVAVSVLFVSAHGLTLPATKLLGDGSFLGADANRVLILRLFVYISALFTVLGLLVVYFAKFPEEQNTPK